MTSLLRITPPKVPKILKKTSHYKPCDACTYFYKGTCTLFFSQDPVGGELIFFDSDSARMDDKLCGPDGNLFKKKVPLGPHKS